MIRDSQIEYMRINGEIIAARAWNGYKAKGRGIVCILSDLEDESFQKIPFNFMGELDAAKLLKPWYGSNEARMTASYDPRKEVVICFVHWVDGNKISVDSYKAKTRPTPPDAVEELRSSSNPGVNTI